ncbi:hypothetical protein ES703_36538 [subsurface metagenome]
MKTRLIQERVFVLSEKLVKNVCVALTTPYLDAIEGLIREDVYVNRANLIKDALRRLFRHYGIESFGAEEPEEGKAERPK